MPVIRVEKTKNYTVMSNYHLQDKNISLKAKGLLSYMLSLPEYWEYSIAGLAAICKEGPDCIRTTIKELENAGYITRSRERTENGQLGGIDYTVREHPVKTEKPKLENPMQDVPEQDTSAQDKPTEIKTIPIKDESIKNVSKNSLTPPASGECEVKQSKRDIEFESFWQAYPRKKNKIAARKAFDKVKVPLQTLLDAIDRQKRSTQWSKDGGQFIPYPASWLNKGAWDDEPEIEYDRYDTSEDEWNPEDCI